MISRQVRTQPHDQQNDLAILDLLQRSDTEDAETMRECRFGDVDEHKAVVAFALRVGGQYRVVLVEAGERLGELVEVAGDPVGFVQGRGFDERGGIGVDMQREGPFVIADRQLGVHVWNRPIGLAQDGRQPSVGVLQVDAGVAGERNHALGVEAVVAGAADGQVGVFDRAYPGGFGDGIELGCG